jgi:hypothetical protein
MSLQKVGQVNNTNINDDDDKYCNGIRKFDIAFKIYSGTSNVN